jgi:phospholipase A1
MFRVIGLLLLLLQATAAIAAEADTPPQANTASQADTATDSGSDGDGPAPGVETGESLVKKRIKRERAAQDNASVLLAHRRNYFLPVTYARDPNNAVFDNESGLDGDLNNFEAQFQISLKLPVTEDLFIENDAVYAAFTLRAFWQVYNKDISAPFRESNYEPEIFWITPVPWTILGGDATLVSLGLSHQSNGRSQPYSRSWNRVYASLIWERWRYVFHLKTWWRIPEEEKSDPLDPHGDDNPDIEDYMGNFEFEVVFRQYDNEFSAMIRNNLDFEENHGALQLDWTFPLQGRFRGYLQYFNGYGESLIDYDAHIQRIGIGILLTDLL